MRRRWPSLQSRLASLMEERCPAKRFAVAISTSESTIHNVDCAVCLSRFQEEEMVCRELQCGHVFHKDCIDKWVLEHHGRHEPTCPLCRKWVLPEGVVVRERQRLWEREEEEEEDQLLYLLYAFHGANLNRLL